MKYRLSAIWLRTLSTAQEVLEKLTSDGDFSELAKTYSTGAGKGRGGDLGFLLPEDLLPELRSAADQLDVGESSGIIFTRRGDYAILMKTDEKPVMQ